MSEVDIMCAPSDHSHLEEEGSEHKRVYWQAKDTMPNIYGLLTKCQNCAKYYICINSIITEPYRVETVYYDPLWEIKKQRHKRLNNMPQPHSQ